MAKLAYMDVVAAVAGLKALHAPLMIWLTDGRRVVKIVVSRAQGWSQPGNLEQDCLSMQCGDPPQPRDEASVISNAISPPQDASLRRMSKEKLQLEAIADEEDIDGTRIP